MYVYDDENHIVGASSRRFDGAYPNILNPRIVWEIKEYYYATTFGSRVADGVYETQLDGYEFKDISQRSGKPITHVFMRKLFHMPVFVLLRVKGIRFVKHREY